MEYLKMKTTTVLIGVQEASNLNSQSQDFNAIYSIATQRTSLDRSQISFYNRGIGQETDTAIVFCPSSLQKGVKERRALGKDNKQPLPPKERTGTDTQTAMR